MLRSRGLVAALSATALVLTACGGGADEPEANGEGGGSAESAAEFYAGKTLTFITRDAGGGFDTDTRLLAKYFEEALDINVVVENEPGAGGLIALNDMANNREPDGLTMGLIAGTGAISSAMVEAEGVQYDMQEDFEYVGLVTPSTHMVFTGADSEYQAWEDILAAPAGSVRMGTEGPGAGDTLLGHVLMEVFDIELDLIPGFSAPPEILLALYAGDVDLQSGSTLSRSVEVEAGDTRSLVIMGEDDTIPVLEDVPSVFDFELSEEQEKIANTYRDLNVPLRTILTPAGLPEERLQLLRDTYIEIVESDEFQAEVEELERDFQPMNGEELDKLINDLIDNMPDRFLELMREAYGQTG